MAPGVENISLGMDKGDVAVRTASSAHTVDVKDQVISIVAVNG